MAISPQTSGSAMEDSPSITTAIAATASPPTRRSNFWVTVTSRRASRIVGREGRVTGLSFRPPACTARGGVGHLGDRQADLHLLLLPEHIEGDRLADDRLGHQALDVAVVLDGDPVVAEDHVALLQARLRRG